MLQPLSINKGSQSPVGRRRMCNAAMVCCTASSHLSQISQRRIEVCHARKSNLDVDLWEIIPFIQYQNSRVETNLVNLSVSLSLTFTTCTQTTPVFRLKLNLFFRLRENYGTNCVVGLL